MTDALSRQEYPAMLERLQPAGAVAKFNERVKKINKTNTEIAEWLNERRTVEENYVMGLKKLARRPLKEIGSDLGIFTTPWNKILEQTEKLAKSHASLSDALYRDVCNTLVSFATEDPEMSGMAQKQSNLATMAKELDSAQDKSDKLSRKGGKASAQKVDAAASSLRNATELWDAQAPFMFESLQAIDEKRLNKLRDVLTQYETLQLDQATRDIKVIEDTMATLLEIDTATEIFHWSSAAVVGKPITERKARQLSSATGQSTDIPGVGGSSSVDSSNMPPPTPRSTHTDTQSQHSSRPEAPPEPKESQSRLKSRFGTMLTKRRQSMHGTFARAPSPSKGYSPFGSGRNTASRDGRPSPSPQASMNNLHESTRDNRLSSLAESPTSNGHGNANGTGLDSAFVADEVSPQSSNTNGTSALPDLTDVQPPPGPPPSHVKAQSQTDADGFTVPAAMNDPISQAQYDAQALEGDQPQFKVDIQKEPIPEQDADAQAALSSVANALRTSQMTTPNRLTGTVRGRRDQRSTIFVPPPVPPMPSNMSTGLTALSAGSSDFVHPPSPGVTTGRAAALATLSAGHAPSASDTTSIRSGHSLKFGEIVKHAEMHAPGLNASIIETVNATFENGVAKTMKVSGEIALIYNKAGDEDETEETIRIVGHPNLEALGPNTTVISPIEDKQDEFKVNLSALSSKPIAFTYRVHVDEAHLDPRGLLLINCQWKPRGDNLGLVIEYSLDPACSTEPIHFNTLDLVAIHRGARATGCKTKPNGTHLKDRSLTYWRMKDVTISQVPQKIICQFMGSAGSVPEAGHIEARWEINSTAISSLASGSGVSVSRLTPCKGKEKEESDDPFADESTESSLTTSPANWVELETHRKLVSGKYEARQVGV